MSRGVARRPPALLSVGLVGLLALVSTGCSSGFGNSSATSSPTGIKGGVLRVAVPVSPATSTWDPLVANPATQRAVGPAVMATLLRPDPAGGEPTPWLAERVESDGAARVWTITLREGITFAGGSPLTSADVVFMLTQAAQDPTLSTRFGADDEGTWFTSAVAQDERTVVLSVRKGNSAMRRLVLAAPEFGCVARNFGGKTREDYYQAPDSCGPFVIAPSSEGASGTTRLVRNPDYFAAGDVFLNGMTVAAGAKAQREADVAIGVQPGIASAATATTTTPPASTTTPRATPTGTESELPAQPGATSPVPTETPGPSAVREWPEAQVVLSPPGVSALLVLRNATPTTDTNLRQALKASIDYEAMVRAAPGAVVPSSGLTPAGWVGAVELPTPVQRLDIATLAADLVPEDAREVTLILDRSDAVAQRRANSIVVAAQRAGISIDVNSVGGRDLDRAIAQGRFEAALVEVAPTSAVAAEVSRLWAWSAGFGGRWSPEPGRTAYALQITRPSDVDRAATATARFEDANRRGAWVVPLASDPHRTGVAPRVLGVAVSPEGAIAWQDVSLRPSGAAATDSAT